MSRGRSIAYKEEDPGERSRRTVQSTSVLLP
jgi:hypothetical protein